MIPALRLLDAFKREDHQAMRVPIPFERFCGGPLYQVCPTILFDGGTNPFRIGFHALPIEDLEISNDIGCHVSTLRVCSFPFFLVLPLLLHSALPAALPEVLRGNTQRSIKFA